MARVLVVGYGNPLRSDDGVGWHAAHLLAESVDNSSVEVLARHQLTPELAEPISRADLTIFIDASCESEPGQLTWKRVDPDPNPVMAFTHHLSPSTLLACAQELYGTRSEAVLLSVGTATFRCGQDLSPTVSAALPQVVDGVSRLAVSGPAASPLVEEFCHA